MFSKPSIRSLLPLAAMGVFAMPLLASAQSMPQNSPQATMGQSPVHQAEIAPVIPTTPPQSASSYTSAGNSSGSGVPVYDLAPAMARASFAAAEYDRAYTDMSITVLRVRQNFPASQEMAPLRRELDEAQRTYDAASSAVIANVARGSSYQSLLQRKNDLDADLHKPMSPAARHDIADQKMKVGAALTRMEADALANDNNVRQAKSHLVAAQNAVADRTAKFEAELYDNAQITAARQALAQAKLNRAAADGNLSGALATRADIIAADERRYPNTGNYAVGGNYDPYFGGYYGLGLGGFGSVITTSGFGGFHRGF